MTELQNVEIPRDRYGRPMVIPPQGGNRVPYRRVTTFVDCLENKEALIRWNMQQVTFGMGQRKDLVLASAASDPNDKNKLNDIAYKAKEHALASAPATTGTALHALTERIDRGQPLGYVPHEYEADIRAYEKTTAHIEYTGIEAFRVHDNWKVAGTADRIGRLHGKPMIMDIKTGSIDYPHKMAMQLAMYAHSTPYDIASDAREPIDHDLDMNRGIIIHLPAGQGRCDLYEIDISKGWAACLIAKKVWEWRDTKNLTRYIDPDRDEELITTWELLTLRATNVDELRTIWVQANRSGELTQELKNLITTRKDSLGGAA